MMMNNMTTPGMRLIKSKNVGDFKVKLAMPSAQADTSVLMFWSKSLSKEIYQTGMMNKNRAMDLYKKMTSEPKVVNFLKRKIQLTPSMLRMNW